jgi:4-hydroxybenzoate polyprenyltransferase
MKLLLELLRYKQWVKNVFLIFPLIFSGRFLEWMLWDECLRGIFIFCLIASAMYIINDIIDLKEDRLHPQKSKRPLTAGKISIPTALVTAVSALILGLILSWQFNQWFFIYIATYILLNVLYNLWAKHIVIVDVLIVSFCFQIRILAGAAATHILPSLWLLMCVFVLALFLGFTKRRWEISTLKSDAPAHRGVLEYYNSYLLDQLINISSTLAIVFYGLYTISPEVVQRIGGYEMFYSTPFVIYGIFRYLYLNHVRKLGGEPEDILLSDLPLLIDIILWIIFVVAVISFSKFR